MKVFTVLVSKVTAEYGKNDPDTERQEAFVKFGHRIEGYVPKIRAAY